jgi:hypothetical protein
VTGSLLQALKWIDGNEGVVALFVACFIALQLLGTLVGSCFGLCIVESRQRCAQLLSQKLLAEDLWVPFLACASPRICQGWSPLCTMLCAALRFALLLLVLSC